MDAAISDTPIQSKDDLFAILHDACRPRDQWLIGAEMEKFGVQAKDGAPVTYERHILPIFEVLIRDHGWTPQREADSGPIIALTRNGASITLEPGGQFELSGAPLVDVHAVAREFDEHLRELAPVSKDIRWLGLGFHPFARREDLSWVPKQRYGIMRNYLPTRGSLALDMMLRTSTVQANYDYANEEDAMRKLRVALKLSPLTTAIFANSPFYEGKAHGGVSYRAKVWLDVDPDRSGLVPAVWKEKSKFADYIEWALDVPMFLVKRDGAPIANTKQTFRRFLAEGVEGYRATEADWQTHLNTLFPEVRLKRTLEIRGADAQTGPMAMALPALWAGILYDDTALAQAESMCADWTYDEVQASRTSLWTHGLRTPWRKTTFRALAEQLLTIAESGLARRGKVAAGKDEAQYLAHAKALVARGETPADALLAATQGGDLRQRIIAQADLIAAQGIA